MSNMMRKNMSDLQELKTAKEWYSEIHEKTNTILVDVDGFDREENFIYAWNEKLMTKLEYFNRICECTLYYKD